MPTSAPPTRGDPLEALRVVRTALLEREDPSSALVARAISGMLDHGLSFEDALGLAGGWRVHARLAARDTALRALASMLPPMSGRALAAKIIAGCDRYAASAWPTESAANRRPDGLRGMFFDVLKAGGPPALSQLRAVLRGWPICPLATGHPTPDALEHDPEAEPGYRRQA